MFKKIAVSSLGYPGLALAYWVRFLSPLVEIYVPEEVWRSDPISVRRWDMGLGLLGRRFVEDVLGVEAGRPGDEATVKVVVREPSLVIGGRRHPLYSRASLDMLLREECVKVRGPGARQLEAYLEERGLRIDGEDCLEATVEGATYYDIVGPRGRVSVWGGVLDENVEQAAAEAAMRILGIPPGPRAYMDVLVRGGSVEFTIGGSSREHSVKARVGGCHLRVGTSGGDVAYISGTGCSLDSLRDSLLLLLGSGTADWMPLLAVTRSPLFSGFALIRGLLGLWRKNLPRRALQLGEGAKLGILV